MKVTTADCERVERLVSAMAARFPGVYFEITRIIVGDGRYRWYVTWDSAELVFADDLATAYDLALQKAASDRRKSKLVGGSRSTEGK